MITVRIRWLLVALGLAVGLIVWRAAIGGRSEPFDPTKWQSAREDVRDRMSEDLARSGALHGKTVSEIEEMLGPMDCWEHRLAYDLDQLKDGPAIVFQLDRHGDVRYGRLSGMTSSPAYETFDTATWRADPGRRLGMALDITRTGRFDGYMHSELVEILGPPSNVWGPQMHYEGRQIDGTRRFYGKVLRIEIRDGIAVASEHSGS